MITAYLKSIFVLALRVMCGTLLVRVWQDKGVIIYMALVVEGREFKWYEEWVTNRKCLCASRIEKAEDIAEYEILPSPQESAFRNNFSEF